MSGASVREGERERLTRICTRLDIYAFLKEALLRMTHEKNKPFNSVSMFYSAGFLNISAS